MFNGLKMMKDKDFMKSFLRIAIPIIIQNLFSTSLNFVDGILIGGYGSSGAIAAVALANKVFFLYSLVSFGLISGATIFFAQYYGNKDYHKLKRTMGMTLLMVTLVSVIFSSLAIFIPEKILSTFSSDAYVIKEGASYLKWVAISYIFTGISFTFVSAMRAINDTFRPMIASISAVLLNIVVSYVLIYGKLGLPSMGVKGAALGTTIARVIELILMFSFVMKREIIKPRISELMDFGIRHLSTYFKVSLPVILSESFWALGIIAYTYSYSSLGTSSLAAVDIGSNISEIFFVLSFGICHGAAIMVGNSLGAGDKAKAKSYGSAFVSFAILSGIGTGLVLLLMINPILSLYKVDDLTRLAALRILLINVLLMPIRFMNILFMVGIFRGGGDTKFALKVEILGLWIIGIPLSFLMAYRGLPIHIVYLAHFLEELVKMILSIPRYLKDEWLRRVIEHE